MIQQALVQSCRVFAMAAIMIMGSSLAASAHAPDEYPRHELNFNRNGNFKIVQFTDTQDGPNTDARTVKLINRVLDDQHPDLVVFTGDQLTSQSKTAADVRRAIDNVVRPVDSRRIPWLITFGNHDEDHTANTGLDREAQLRIYMSYPFNVNQASPVGVAGSGNMNIIVHGSRNSGPVFNVWALDSGKYAPEKIADQIISDDYLMGWSWMPNWDWIKTNQVAWYLHTSERIERENGRRIPSLMFFHIPLQEFRQMYENDAAKRQHPELGLAAQHGVLGERNEDECPGTFNSGLFAAMLARGDVKGVFVGHDHVNDYVGNYFGIYLGYSANTGFGTYGLDGADKNRLRGARVFVVHESDPQHFDTGMVFAKDYGIQ
jgi:3',5'-cyclic AMP phosphodiesterase CpdA